MRNKHLWKIFALFFVMTFFSCQESGDSPAGSQAVESAEQASQPADTAATGEAPASEQTPSAEDFREVVVSPGVVLRDDAKVWDSRDGVLSDQPLASLDMGTEVVSLGIEEELRSGNRSYRYSKVRLGDGTEGWISSVRLGTNAVPAVVVEASGLYKKPLVTAPVNRTVPAGQIVAVSLEKGNVNGFAEIVFSYYDDDTLSNPETRYIAYDRLSVSSNDLEAAKLVLKASRNPDLSGDFYNLALSLGSIFETFGTFRGTPAVYRDTDLSAESVSTSAEIKLLAVNPLDKGEAMPWYLGQIGNNELVWVPAGSVTISPALREKLAEKPSLEDNTSYRGDGIPAVNLYQGLSLRKMVKDDQGQESLVSHSSLELGEVVYSSSREFQFDNITFVYVDFPNGEGGWSSRNYIAENAGPAVITEEGIPVFKEPKLTALSSIKLQKYQVVAVHKEEVSGFLKISYLSREDGSLQKDVYIQSSRASLSYKDEDVHAALLLEKMLRAEDAEEKDLFLKKTAAIPSFLREDLEELYYGQDSDAVGTAVSEAE